MSSKKPDPQLLEISKKLDKLIRLSALGLVRDIKTQKEQIALLSDAGFQPRQIADILGTTRNTVNVTLTAIRKERAERESKEKGEEGVEVETKREVVKNAQKA